MTSYTFNYFTVILENETRLLTILTSVTVINKLLETALESWTTHLYLEIMFIVIPHYIQLN